MNFFESIRSYQQRAADLDVLELQPLIDRFAKAKWLTGQNIDAPDYCLIHFSELGHREMRKLAEAIEPFALRYYDRASRPRLPRRILQYLKLAIRLQRVRRCLQPPMMSGPEVDILVALIFRYWHSPNGCFHRK